MPWAQGNILDQVLAFLIQGTLTYLVVARLILLLGGEGFCPGVGLPAVCFRIFPACALYVPAKFSGSLFLDDDGLWADARCPDRKDRGILRGRGQLGVGDDE